MTKSTRNGSGGIWWLLCVAMSVFAQSGEGARRDHPKVKTILVLGDSLSAGFRLLRSEAYPALLTEKMRLAGYNDWEMTNAGWSGDTSAGGLRRLPKYLDRTVDILVLELGINDAFRGVPVAEIRANLQAIIDKTRALNPKVEVMIAGMQVPLSSEDDYVRAFGEMFGAMATSNRAALVPYLLEGVGGDPALNLPDRVHPNAAGQKILAANVWRVLEPIVAKKTRAPI